MSVLVISAYSHSSGSVVWTSFSRGCSMGVGGLHGGWVQWVQWGRRVVLSAATSAWVI